MTVRVPDRHALAIALALAVATAIAGCGSKEPAPAPTAPPAASTSAEPAAAPAATPAPVTAEDVANQAWTPEALEDLLAPIALYPDPVLSQVLIASTNPQEVLDAGNWLIANEKLAGKALDEAAAKAGFTPPIRALIQFPQTVDMMCMELDWTSELGRAFVADQAGVLDAVQRLRRQAMDVGNLKSSEAMKVDVEQQEGEEVVVLKPPKPEVVYVPTYDPVTAYAPPAATAPAAAPAATTTTTTVEDDDDTGKLLATGLLAFGAGILVNEAFDDDDDYYYPHYGYGGMPYYPPYPYRPVYGGGYYPSNGYNRPPNWNGGFQNNGNIVINTGGNQYWDRYDTRPGQGGAGTRGSTRKVSSPITQARPNRPELAQLNQRTPRAMPDAVARPSNKATASDWKGQSSYAGRNKRPAGSTDTATRIAEASPKYSAPAAGSAAGSRPTKVQGSYAGKERARPASQEASRPTPSQREQPRPEPATRDVKKPGGDRGYGTNDEQRQHPSTREVQRPSPSPSSREMGGGQPHDTALSGASRGGQDRAASQRGRQSMPQGARSKGGGGHNRPGR